MCSRCLKAILLTSSVMTMLCACGREERRLSEPSSTQAMSAISQSSLQPGVTTGAVRGDSKLEYNAFAISEGKRLYDWFNCSGCHAHGGGAIGPPLIDDKWIYGSEPANIFQTIVEGRPNGMPSFRGRIPDQQVWQLVAYVRAMGGDVRKDAAPGRSDHLYTRSQGQPPSGGSTPKASSVPPSAQQ
jgi:cytochrome c oxidase cbb3-type subunit III